MEPDVTRSAAPRIDVFDESGRLIGTITRPVEADILGPGRQKVYLARRPARADRQDQAA